MTKEVPVAEEVDKGLLISVESVSVVSSKLRSTSGIILKMTSSSRTISDMEGLASVSSWQHLVASKRNLLMQSGGHRPIRLSTISEILPDWYDLFTYNMHKISYFSELFVFHLNSCMLNDVIFSSKHKRTC